MTSQAHKRRAQLARVALDTLRETGPVFAADLIGLVDLWTNPTADHEQKLIVALNDLAAAGHASKLPSGRWCVTNDAWLKHCATLQLATSVTYLANQFALLSSALAPVVEQAIEPRIDDEDGPADAPPWPARRHHDG